MTEHRTPVTSASPTILAAAAASVTSGLRVGTAGIMLRYASPLKIAEDFRLLELLYPGRLDLGTISGWENSPEIHAALLDGRPDDAAVYGPKLERLIDLVRGGSAEAGLAGPLAPGPMALGVPEIWSCAISAHGIAGAARAGVGLAYHRYLAHASGRDDGPALVEAYYASFRRNAHLPNPTVAVVCFGCCAENTTEAEAIWRRARDAPTTGRVVIGGIAGARHGLGPDFLGTPEACRSQLEEVARQFGSQELVLHCVGPTAESQSVQYELLASAFGLTRRTAVDVEPALTCVER